MEETCGGRLEKMRPDRADFRSAFGKGGVALLPATFRRIARDFVREGPTQSAF